MQLHCADWAACRWQWLCSEQAASQQSQVPDTGWVAIPGAERHVYTPGAQDTGKLLRVTCTPAQPRSAAPECVRSLNADQG